MLNVDNVSFSYGKRRILDKATFDVEPGSTVALLGCNGAGKTTLLRCMMGFINPESGHVTLNGSDIHDLSNRERSRMIAYVPQNAISAKMSVYESVLLGRRPYMNINYCRNDLDLTSSMISRIGLSELSLSYADEISGGEFQKVQIARAITQEPKILILDEPSNNLDIANQHVTMRMVEHVVRQHGLCTVMTMHDINLATYYSDRFMFVKNGRIVAYGGSEVITPETIRDVYGIDVDVIQHKGQAIVVPLKEQPNLDDLTLPGVGGHGHTE